MADNETIADIIAEMRGIRVREFQEYADRLEAAHKCERGDAAAMRSCLIKILAEMIDLGGMEVGRKAHFSPDAIAEEIRQALSVPPRNCDVGTAQEQDERFHRFCVKHHTGSCAGCHNPVGDYTVANGVRECALAWAQMPYEEGGVE